ncbi:MAG: hypothetical protein A2901_05650 [Elusimicrobia bacterium RIFCSPLOWO2_01_FULL_54_10]|nr:MAG: hypothetical protein A2901_05650 [Elusimicrobia bacterium RIFCSPLOWO2_01_FULL_54_10]
MLDMEDAKWAKAALKEMEFFSNCSDEDLLTLIDNFEKAHYKSEATILFHGEISNRFYVVCKGSVGIWKNVAGSKQKVAELGERKYFGEISLMTPSSATATVKAQTDVDVLSISYENFEFAFRNNPEQLKAIQKKIEEKKQSLSGPAKS